MNTVVAFLTRNWDRLGLNRFGSPSRLSCIVATPRFRTSRHVIFFVLAEGSPHPILVVKVPRLTGEHSCLDREAANLQAVHAARHGGFDSIPRVLAYECHAGSRVLVESALVGKTMTPALVRRHSVACTEGLITWLTDLHLATTARNESGGDWFERMVEQHLVHLGRVFPVAGRERSLIEGTRMLASVLRDEDIPLVFEHGDLSSPNIMVCRNGAIGVVDWELAEPRGLPAADLFFFLTYVAFARRRARKLEHYLAAFEEAFFGPTAWARPQVMRYAERMDLSAKVIRPLFVLCWSRYVTSLLARLSNGGAHPGGVPKNDTAAWLKCNRYFALWRHAVEHVGNLNLIG